MALVLAFFLLGCGHLRSASSAGARKGSEDLAFPIEPFVYGSPEDRRLLERGTQLAIEECMRKRGLDYASVSPGPEVPIEGIGENPYGFVSSATARRVGYGLTVADGSVTPDGSGTTRIEAPPGAQAQEPAWQEALVGRPDGMVAVATIGDMTISVDPDSCTAQARNRLFEPETREWLQLFYWAQDQMNQVVKKTEAAPRFIAARARWQQCMEAGGYSVGSQPAAAQEYVLERRRNEPVVADETFERAVAERDAACLIETDSWRTVRALQETYEGQTLEEQADRFRRLSELRERALKRANKRIETGSW